jgi:hypothetical protein
MKVFELWEGVSGNLMAAFDTEAEALAAVKRRADRHGPGSVESLSLVASDDEDEDADIVDIASGLDLLRRASPQRPVVRPSATDVPRRGVRLGDIQAPAGEDARA